MEVSRLAVRGGRDHVCVVFQMCQPQQLVVIGWLLCGRDAEPSVIRIESGDLRIIEERKQIYWQDQLLNLTLTEYWLLLALARRPGHVKSHEQLMEAANVVVTNNAITAHIRRIRDKIQEIDPDFNAIRTEYGMGYRWQA